MFNRSVKHLVSLIKILQRGRRRFWKIDFIIFRLGVKKLKKFQSLFLFENFFKDYSFFIVNSQTITLNQKYVKRKVFFWNKIFFHLNIFMCHVWLYKIELFFYFVFIFITGAFTCTANEKILTLRKMPRSGNFVWDHQGNFCNYSFDNLRGLEISLSSLTAFPIVFCHTSLNATQSIHTKFMWLNSSSPFHRCVVPSSGETQGGNSHRPHSLETTLRKTIEKKISNGVHFLCLIFGVEYTLFGIRFSSYALPRTLFGV